MAGKKTGKKVAGKASRELRDPHATAGEKSVAASDLTQAAPTQQAAPKKTTTTKKKKKKKGK